MDAANLIIGGLMLVGGLLGVLFLLVALVTTPQPQVAEGPEGARYPAVDRFVAPLLMPIGVAAAIAAVIFLVSQILLAVPEAAATPIALVVALLILFGCWFFATARRITRPMVYTAIALPVLALLVCGLAATSYRISEANKAAAAAAAAPVTSAIEVTTDNHFSKTALRVAGGQDVTVTQENKGIALHNWHVLDVKDDAGNDITTGAAGVQGGQSGKVTFKLSKPGSYKFVCDFHPAEMIGTLTVQ